MLSSQPSNSRHWQAFLCLTSNVDDILGISDLQGYSYKLHPGRVGPAGHISEKAIHRCNAAEHRPPGLCG